jgi:hypothetical protein
VTVALQSWCAIDTPVTGGIMDRRLSVALAVLVPFVALVLWPLATIQIGSAAAAVAHSASNERLFLQVRGTTDRQSGTPSDQFEYVLDLYDMRNQKVGTVTHDLRLTSPTTGDLTSSFHLTEGTVVNRVEEVFASDSTRPGFFLIGIHPDHDTLQGDRSSGAFAGLTGRVRMSGWHDATRFPQTVALDDFWEIQFTGS